MVDVFLKELERKSFKKPLKKFLYINIWNIGCKPCVDEMQLLESTSYNWINRISNVFVSIHSDKAVDKFIKQNNINCPNFLFINQMQPFILDIYKKIGLTDIVYPVHVVMRNNGDVLAFLIGGFANEKDTYRLVDFIKGLK